MSASLPRGPAPGPGRPPARASALHALDTPSPPPYAAFEPFFRAAQADARALWREPEPPLQRFAPIEEAAARMGRSVEEVRALVRRGVLHAVAGPFGELLVEPAILSGPGAALAPEDA